MCGAWLRILLIAALPIAVTNGEHCGVAGGMTKIVGGQDVGSLNFPWYVALVSPSGSASLQVSCGGSLITTRHVLSAAHCFPRSGVRPEQLYYVVLGLVNRCFQKDPAQAAITNVLIHPDFNPKTLQADVAVITLDHAVSYTPVCLPPRNYAPSGPALIIGFGSTLVKSQYPCTLQEAKINIYSKRQCANSGLAAEFSRIPGTICAGLASGGVDSCDGDSGGPLMTTGKGGVYIVQGIVSFGEGCARRDLPGVYTKVSAYRDFIDYGISSSTEDLIDYSTSTPLHTNESYTPSIPPTPPLHPPSLSLLDMLLAQLRPWFIADAATDSSSGGSNSAAPSVGGAVGTSRPLSPLEYFLLQFLHRNHHRRAGASSNYRPLG